MKHDTHTDRLPDRRGTGAFKWDLARDGEIPLWVADMDFPVAPAVTDALKRRLDHPVFGYSAEPAKYLSAVAAWQRKRNGWSVDESQLIVIPSVMQGIAVIVEEFTSPGDRIGLFSPVYFPFYDVVEELDREVVRIPLATETAPEGDFRYVMDLEALQEAIRAAAGSLKMLLLCSPHNPGGRVWSSEELGVLRAVTTAAGIRVVSDEIHGDLTFPGNRFVPWLRDGEGTSGLQPRPQQEGDNSGDIALFAPSKTFNIPGLPTALAAVVDEETRRRLRGALHARMHKLSNLLTMEAALAAYTHGADWLDALRPVLMEQYNHVVRRCCEIDGVRVFAHEGTFIAWLDFRERWGIPVERRFPVAFGRYGRHGGDGGNGTGSTPLPGDSVSTRFGAHARKEGVWLSDGFQFGPEGEGFMRLNFATSREILDEGLNRLARSATTFGK